MTDDISQDARKKEADKRDTLAWAVVIGFFLMMGLLYFFEVPEGSQATVNQLCGALTLAFGAVVNYRYGSSAGSAQKTEIMAERAKNGGTAP